MVRTLLVAVSLVALSSAGVLADPSLHATLASPTKETGFVVGSVAWRCDGTSCATTSPLQDMGPKRLCRELVRKVGAVASFDTLDATQLQTCNASKG